MLSVNFKKGAKIMKMGHGAGGRGQKMVLKFAIDNSQFAIICGRHPLKKLVPWLS